ncbi:hypothetical protein CGLO_09582 [Colletotrichum gloeosporioides Cg-14]|uniref:Fungal N-terminal domain-containing protein n=1 Tax=Colletotrichum gloeosporioides (strain Cg-14) TaxID=1237896 RepID=T0LHA6_COLGC|nr:hypothetical protein CGLO_09582 [Colletotrichum gloeosporioides Cg-14]
MAELLGTVVGVVSLGLQVCSGITKYLDGIKGHKDEIASASRLCLSLQGAVDQIQAMRNNIATASRGHDTAIEQAMMAANAELEVLRMFVDDIRVNEDPSKSISEWIKDRTNRVAYPFRRGHLDRLESQLSEANNALQSAIQATQLAISIETVNVTRSIGDKFREEDSRAIKILHGLLPEFEMKLAEANCSVSEFMATVWKSRMEQVLADFYEPHNLTEDNMREILGMGVNLQVQDEDESEDELFVNKPLEYHVAELDKIMEEIDV